MSARLLCRLAAAVVLAVLLGHAVVAVALCLVPVALAAVALVLAARLARRA